MWYTFFSYEIIEGFGAITFCVKAVDVDEVCSHAIEYLAAFLAGDVLR
jgi:hypothetical protein